MRVLLVGTNANLLHFDVAAGKLVKIQKMDTEVVALAYVAPYKLVAIPGGPPGKLDAPGTLIDFWYAIEACAKKSSDLSVGISIC